jgi:hypothetical protein
VRECECGWRMGECVGHTPKWDVKEEERDPQIKLRELLITTWE